MKEPMTPSERCLSLVKAFEGFRAKSYKCPAGKWTCGFGTTRGIDSKTTCTPEQAEEWLRRDIEDAAKAVNESVHVPITQDAFDACVDFAYNVGTSAFRNSTLLKRINGNQHDLAAAEFDRWIFANGKALKGLQARRAAEKQLFLGNNA